MHRQCIYMQLIDFGQRKKCFYSSYLCTESFLNLMSRMDNQEFPPLELQLDVVFAYSHAL